MLGGRGGLVNWKDEMKGFARGLGARRLRLGGGDVSLRRLEPPPWQGRSSLNLTIRARTTISAIIRRRQETGKLGGRVELEQEPSESSSQF